MSKKLEKQQLEIAGKLHEEAMNSDLLSAEQKESADIRYKEMLRKVKELEKLKEGKQHRPGDGFVMTASYDEDAGLGFRVDFTATNIDESECIGIFENLIDKLKLQRDERKN